MRLASPDLKQAPPHGTRTHTCRICGDAGPKGRFVAREMVHGTREPFDYLLCGGCGTLYLADFPADIGRYYKNYYSTGVFAESPAPPVGLKDRLKSSVKNPVCRAAMRFPSTWSTRILERWIRLPAYLGFRSLQSLGLDAKAAILDVGCGSGYLIEALDRMGFGHVCGCDPFLEREILFQGGARLLKRDLTEVEGIWDVIMLHHCFEHVPNPAATAELIDNRLGPGGRCLLRFPNVDSVEFARYGANWWGIHAPRHYHLLSRRGLERVLANTHLEIERVWCDSLPDHYCYSYEYSLDIADGDQSSVRKLGTSSPHWSEQEMEHIGRNVEWYNRQLIGDWIVYVLRKRD